MSGTAPWSVYVLRCGDGSLYTGIAKDVARRMAEHAAGARGAKALRGRGPFALVLRIDVGEHGPALKLERRIKRLPKAEKERLLGSPARRRALLAAAGVTLKDAAAGVTLKDRERPAGRAAGARSRPSS